MGFSTAVNPEDIAKETESGGKFINESGVFFGEITACEYSKTPNGAGFVSVSLKTGEGKELLYAQFCAIKNDGSDSYGMAFFKAMCLFTGVTPSDPVQSQKDTTKWSFPLLYKKKIGIGIQMEYRDDFKADGFQKTNKNVVAVFDYGTKRSVGEITENKPAQKWLIAIEDKGKKQTKRTPEANAAMGYGGESNFGEPPIGYGGESNFGEPPIGYGFDSDLPF
jgi:hypothetical protein